MSNDWDADVYRMNPGAAFANDERLSHAGYVETASGMERVMKAKPILMTGDVIRAIRDGHKTQMRRVADIARIDDHPMVPEVKIATLGNGKQGWMNSQESQPYQVSSLCPFGQPGDLLWVRETFADLTRDLGRRWERFNPQTRRYDHGVLPFFWYKADGETPDCGNGDPIPARWRPSVAMPRYASRLTLHITEVRVQRLQEISEQDAYDEGTDEWCGEYIERTRTGKFKNIQSGFQFMWDSIHAKRGHGWYANPWVWAITFEPIWKNVDEVLREVA